MNKKQKIVLVGLCICAMIASACWYFSRPHTVNSEFEAVDYQLSEDEKTYLLESALSSIKKREETVSSKTEMERTDSEKSLEESGIFSESESTQEGTKKSEASSPTGEQKEQNFSSSGNTTDSVKSESAVSAADKALSPGALTVQAQVDAQIERLYKVQDQFEERLWDVIREAYSEYMAYPKDERSSGLKVKIVVGKVSDISALEKECDAEVAQITGEMTTILKANNMDTTIVKEVEKTYKNKKTSLKKELISQAYSGGDGSGTSGHWLDSHNKK